MQAQPTAITEDAIQQIRNTLRRVRALHDPAAQSSTPGNIWRVVELPKADAVAWEDTEIDVRRRVL